jgi:hypothetical protein
VVKISFVKGHDFTSRKKTRLKGPRNEGTALQFAEKTQLKGLCNKGTASAGPIRSAERVGLQALPIHPCQIRFSLGLFRSLLGI